MEGSGARSFTVRLTLLIAVFAFAFALVSGCGKKAPPAPPDELAGVIGR